MKELDVHEKSDVEPEFSFYIDFSEGEGRPQRVFESAIQIISAFEIIDQTLADCIGNIETRVALERVEAGSLKGVLKLVLTNIDDADIRDLNIRRILGNFFVDAKYKILEWANEDENQRTARRLPALSDELQKIASETGVKLLPDYSKPNMNKLASSISKIAEAKASLGESDRLFVESGSRRLEVSAYISWPPDELQEILTEERVIAAPGRAVLVIKKPDFLGKSKWHVRYNGHVERVKIADEKWLLEYQLGHTEPIGPGDALEVELKVEQRRDDKRNIIEQQLTVTKVHRIHHKDHQLKFLEE